MVVSCEAYCGHLHEVYLRVIFETLKDLDLVTTDCLGVGGGKFYP